MKGLRMVVVGLALAGALSVPGTARAGYLDDAGWGSLTMLANVAYMPAKMIYAAVGGLTGGLAYACTAGDLDTAESIWSPSLGGTYVLTPGMLRGEQGVAFAGGRPSRERRVAESGKDPVAWPGVEVEEDDFAGTTFGRSDDAPAPVDRGLGGF